MKKAREWVSRGIVDEREWQRTAFALSSAKVGIAWSLKSFGLCKTQWISVAWPRSASDSRSKILRFAFCSLPTTSSIECDKDGQQSLTASYSFNCTITSRRISRFFTASSSRSSNFNFRIHQHCLLVLTTPPRILLEADYYPNFPIFLLYSTDRSFRDKWN